MPPEAQARAHAFLHTPASGPRHRLLRTLHEEQAWPLDRCYQHTMEFLRAKEIDRQPLDQLYYHRGLSSDTAPASTAILDALGQPRRILLAGPGLDLTRREHFQDHLPLRSYQYDYLRTRFRQAQITLADVRPEVTQLLPAQRLDVTTEFLPGPFDLIIATNLLLYFEDRELLTALATFTQSLAPGGRLLHNDQRFAAKLFGEALGLTLERFTPHELAPRQGIQQWDRAVIHRKALRKEVKS